MALIKRSIFQGKEYLDLIQQGKQMVVDKLIYIVKHKTLVADSGEANAGSVSVYGVPHHGEQMTDKTLVDAQRFNLPTVAGGYCSTVIDAAGWNDNYEAIIIDIDWEGADGVVYLQDVGTEGVKFRSTKPLGTEADNTT